MIIDFIIDIIKPQVSLNKVLLHFSNDPGIAKNILRDGFNYSEYYEKSTMSISLDKVEIKHNLKM